jgi:4a-hydroxytetrahydrobiopterin dehydratase
MTRPHRLPEEELARSLEALSGWQRDGDGLVKTFRFAGFAEAFGFMAACAVDAQAMDHHPEWFNCHDRVEVRLRTHDAGGITALDVQLAHRMNALAGQ